MKNPKLLITNIFKLCSCACLCGDVLASVERIDVGQTKSKVISVPKNEITRHAFKNIKSFPRAIAEEFPNQKSIFHISKEDKITLYSKKKDEKWPSTTLGKAKLIVAGFEAELKDRKNNTYIGHDIFQGAENVINHITTKHISCKSDQEPIVIDNTSGGKLITAINLISLFDYLKTYVQNSETSRSQTTKFKFATLFYDIFSSYKGSQLQNILEEPEVGLVAIDSFLGIFGSTVDIYKKSDPNGCLYEFIQLNIKEDCRLVVIYHMSNDKNGDTILDLRTMYPDNVLENKLKQDKDAIKMEGIKYVSIWYDTLGHLISFSEKFGKKIHSKKSANEFKKNTIQIVRAFWDNQLKYDMSMFYEDFNNFDEAFASAYTAFLIDAFAVNDDNDFPRLVSYASPNDKNLRSKAYSKMWETMLYDPANVFSQNEISFLGNFFIDNLTPCFCMLLDGQNKTLKERISENFFLNTVALGTIEEGDFLKDFAKSLLAVCSFKKNTAERQEKLKDLHNIFLNMFLDNGRIRQPSCKKMTFIYYCADADMDHMLLKLKAAGTNISTISSSFSMIFMINKVLSSADPKLTLFIEKGTPAFNLDSLITMFLAKPSRRENAYLTNIKNIKEELQRVSYPFYYYFMWSFVLRDYLKSNKDLRKEFLSQIDAEAGSSIFPNMLSRLLKTILKVSKEDSGAVIKEIQDYINPSIKMNRQYTKK